MSGSDSCRVKRSKRIAKKKAKLLPLNVTTLSRLGLLQLHECTKLHEAKFAQGHKIARRRLCT